MIKLRETPPLLWKGVRKMQRCVMHRDAEGQSFEFMRMQTVLDGIFPVGADFTSRATGFLVETRWTSTECGVSWLELAVFIDLFVAEIPTKRVEAR
eukprot:12694476-Alexandrium_andersonii.AAC.1